MLSTYLQIKLGFIISVQFCDDETIKHLFSGEKHFYRILRIVFDARARLRLAIFFYGL